jgi:hypothetical protein
MGAAGSRYNGKESALRQRFATNLEPRSQMFGAAAANVAFMRRQEIAVVTDALLAQNLLRLQKLRLRHWKVL